MVANYMNGSWILIVVPLLVLAACAEPDSRPDERANNDTSDSQLDVVLADALQRMRAYADTVEEALRPVPLLRPAETAAFRRYRNPQQLAAARRFGIAQPVTEDAIAQHLEAGRLVQLSDNEYWTLRETRFGIPLATPDLEWLLTEIGRRFHDRIEELGLPKLRLEITSLLRTQQDQEELRRTNPNAAIGESTHQYGTTVDITYASFRAPQQPVVELEIDDAPWLEPHLRDVERMAAETGAARMSRELQAMLGRVLAELQDEGLAMVTLEVLQPVYHLTVARAVAD